MTLGDFNEESEKPAFIYKANPLVPRSYQIFLYKDEKNDYEPVGEYTVLDQDEEQELSDSRISNLVMIMNGRSRTLDLKSLTKQRILFNMVPSTSHDKDLKVMFRSQESCGGVSQENALLVIEKGLFDEFT